MPTHGVLTSNRYDLVIVGGGIHGLFAAYDAASRGLTVALVERGDFGSGLSFNHQRTIHGGLRALEHGDLWKVRSQLAERRTWARIAPHLVRVLPFATGTYRFTKRSKTLLRAGFAVYNLLGRSRNDGVAARLGLPRARVEPADAMAARFPGIVHEGLTGGAVWYHYQAHHPDRLNWLVALAAIRKGATLYNYVEAVGPLSQGGAFVGVRCRDVTSGHEADLEAGAILIAAGSGLSAMHQAFGLRGAPPLVYAANLLLDRPAGSEALAAPGRNGRMLTAVPWRGFVLVGTFQSRDLVDPAAAAPGGLTIDDMLEEANHAFPRLSARSTDVLMLHQGLTPAISRNGQTDLMPESVVLRHGVHDRSTAGVLSLVGVKFTTARRTAEQAIDIASEHLSKATAPCRTAATVLPFADVVSPGLDGRIAAVALDDDIVEHLVSWYGDEAPAVADYSARAHLLDRLAPGTPVVAGEVAYAAEQAHALHLGDAVLRRTALGSAGHPGDIALRRAAGIMGRVLGWTEDDTARELALLERVYPVARVTSPRTP